MLASLQAENGSTSKLPARALSSQNRAVATSLLKALDLLSVIARNPKGMSVTQLVPELKVPRTSVLRMLQTFELYGLVDKTGRFWQTTDQFHHWAARPDED